MLPIKPITVQWADNCTSTTGQFRSAALPLAIALAVSGLAIAPVSAAPAGGSVVAGSGSISVQGNTTSIDQVTDRLALDWQSFDIDSNEIVRFNQPGKNSLALNRILSNNPSKIMGLLESNGRIILANPAGILFTENSTVNVDALIASGLNLSVDDFMAGNLLFSAIDGADGVVINRGLINATTSVSLLGKGISNEGPAALIQAQLVTFNAASEALLTFDEAGMIGVRVNKEVLQNTAGFEAAVSNSGDIVAGSVLIEADVAAGLFERAVNNEGLISAAGIDVSGGEIRLSGRGGDTFNSGTLNVSSQQAKGGRVFVEGDRVALVGEALIDASGASGGGEVLVGGDYKGQNPVVQNATQTLLGENAVIDASAVTGDGGRVIVWSDDYTQVAGSISVASEYGDAGFIETSGAKGLRIADSITIDIASLWGKGGHWLIDPDNITINNAGPDANITGSPNFVDDVPADGNEPVLTWTTIENVLDDGDVTVTTSEAGPGDGVITIADSYTFDASASGNTLFLNAATDIVISDGVQLDGAGVDVSLDFTAANDLTVGDGDVVFGVAIDNIAGSVSLTATAGTLTVNGQIISTGIDGISADPGNPGLAPGAITLTGAILDINAAITSVGGTGGDAATGNNDGGAGGDGGLIDLIATTGDIAIDALISSTGGQGGGGSGGAGIGGDGGGGGTVQLMANSGTINIASSISSSGGAVGSGAAGGTAGSAGAFSSSSVNFVQSSGTITADTVDIAVGSGDVTSTNTFGDITANGTLNIDGADGADQFSLAGTLSGSAIVIDGDGGDGGGGTDTLVLGTGTDTLSTSAANTVVVDLATDITVNEIDVVDAGDGDDSLSGNDNGADSFVIQSAESVAVNNIIFSDLENVVGGNTSGTDTVTAAATGSSFALTSASAATVDGIDFTEIETFAGGDGADSFSMTGNITATIDAGDGSDSFAGSGADDTFVLQGDNSVTVNDLTLNNLESASGGTGTDTVTGAATGSSFALTSASDATVDSISFSGIETFAGGDGADSFSMTGSITATIDAGNGDDTFIGTTADENFAIQSSESITVNNLALTDLEVVNAGETGGDNDSITGTAGVDAFVLEGSESVTVAGITFNEVESAAGGTGSDTVTAATGGSSFTLTSASAATVDAISFTQIGSFAGGNGADSFSMTGNITATIDAGDGSDSFAGSGADDAFVLQGDNSVTVNDLTLNNLETASGGTGTDTVTGAATGSSFALNSASDATADSIDFSGIETFAGGDDADSFSMTGSITASIDAGDGDDTFIGTTADENFAIQTTESLTVNNLTLTNLEVVDAGETGGDNDSITGTAGVDAFVLEGSESVTVAGITFSGVESADGGAGSDTVTAATGGSSFALTSATAATVDNISFSQIGSFAGGVGADSFSMTGSFSANIDAAGGTDTFTGDSNAADAFILQGANSVSANGLVLSNLELVSAGDTSGTDTVTGAAGGSSFALTSASVATVDSIDFSGIETFAGGAGADSFSMTGNISASINAGDGIDTFNGSSASDTFVLQGIKSVSANSLTLTNLETVTGGTGTDSVTGASGGSSFALTSASAATVDSIGFSGIETFAGGDGADSFAMTGVFSASVDAGGGSDTFNGDASAGDVFVLQGTNSVSANGLVLSNLEAVTGGSVSGTDTVTAASGGSDFALTSASAASVDAISFTQIETFAGGAGNDTFSMTGSFTAAIDADSGSDTFTGTTADEIFALQGSESISVNGLTLTDLEVVNAGENSGDNDTITGTIGDEDFVLQGSESVLVSGINFSQIESAAAGGTGTDTVTGASGGSSFALTSASAAIVDGISFTEIETFTGGAGADTFSMTGSFSASVNAGGGDDTFNGDTSVTDAFILQSANSVSANGLVLSNLENVTGGATGTDTVTGAAIIGSNFALTSASTATVDGIDFSGIETFAGGDGADSFSLTGSISTTINAGDGIDTFSGSSASDAFVLQGINSVSANGLVLTNIEAVTGGTGADSVTSASGGSSFALTSASAGTVDNIGFSGIETFAGDAGDDSFSMTGSFSASVDAGAGDDTFNGDIGVADTFILQGSNSVSANGLVLSNLENVTGGATGADTVTGAVTGSGFALSSASAASVDGIDFSGIETFAGGAGADNFSMTGSFAASVDAGGGSDTFTGSTGADVFVILGTNSVATNGLTFTNLDSVAAGSGSDSLVGSSNSENYALQGDNAVTVSGVAFSNIEAVAAGGTGVDTVTASSSGSNFALTSASAATVDSISFTQIETFAGGAGADTFSMVGSFAAAIDAGAGSDTFSGSAASDAFVLQGANSVSVNGLVLTNLEAVTGGSTGTDTVTGATTGSSFALSSVSAATVDSIDFSGIETFAGGVGADNFSMVGNITGTIDAGAGSDTFNGSSAGDAFVLQDVNSVSANGLVLTNLEAVTGGGTGTDTVTGATGGSSFALTSASAASVDSIAFSGIETFAGGAGADSFSMTGSIVTTIDAGAGSDSFTGSSAADAFVIQGTNSLAVNGLVLTNVEAAAGGAGADSVTGLTSGETYTLTGANALSTSNIAFTGIENVDTGAGADTVVGLAAAENYSLLGAGSFAVQGVSFSNVESVTAGGVGTDSIIGQATGESYLLQNADGVLVSGIAFSGIESINAAAGDDSFTFVSTTTISLDGGEGGETLGDTISGGSNFVVNAQDSGTIDGVGFSNIENLLGSSGNDNFLLSAGSINSVSGLAGNDTFTLAGGSANTLLGGAGSSDLVTGGSAYEVTGSFAGTVDGSSFTGIENLTGSAASDSFVLTTGEIGQLDGQAGDDSFTLVAASYTSLDGGEGGETSGDSLVGAASYIINATDSGTADGSAFANVENLSGRASADDTFTFSSAGALNGAVDGLSGTDSLIFAASAGSVTVNGDGSFQVNGFGIAFSGFETLTAGTATDSLTGFSQYTISGANSGTVNDGSLSFIGFENLAGTTGNDSFSFTSAGSISGMIDGVSGVSDEIDYSSLGTLTLDTNLALTNIDQVRGGGNGFTLTGSTNYTITAENSGNAGSLSFVGWANLTGTAGDDSFVFASGGSLTGVINGAAGSDTVDYSALAAKTLDLAGGELLAIESVVGGDAGFSLINGSNYNITASNGGQVDAVNFSGWGNLSGTTGDDVFAFNGGTVSGQVDGVAGSDLLTVTSGEQHSFVFAGSNAATVDGITILNVANYQGGDLADSFAFEGDVTLSNIDAGLGNDQFDINSSITATITAGGGEDQFTIGENGSIAALDGGDDIDQVVFAGSNASWNFGDSSVELNNIQLLNIERFDDRASASTAIVASGQTVFEEGRLIQFDDDRQLSYQAGGDLSVTGEALVVNALNKAGDVSLAGDSISGGGDISGANLSLNSDGELQLGTLSAPAAINMSAGGVVNIASVDADSLTIQQAGSVELGAVSASSAVINSSGSVAGNNMDLASLSVLAAGDISLQAAVSGGIDISTTAGDILLAGEGDLDLGVIRATGPASAINISTPGALELDVVSTGSRNTGSVSINAAGGISAGRPLDVARANSPDILSGGIMLRSGAGQTGSFSRPILVDSVAAPVIDSLLNFFVGTFGNTPTPRGTSAQAGLSVIDVSSSSGLSSAVQTLIDTLDEIDPGIFKNDALIDREENALALPDSQMIN